MTFKPYIPPVAFNAGALRPGYDLCARLSPTLPAMVTPDVVKAVAWAHVWGWLNDRDKVRILHDLGLHWVEDRMGTSRLEPLPEFYQPAGE